MLEYKFWDLLMGKPGSYPAEGLLLPKKSPSDMNEAPIMFEDNSHGKWNFLAQDVVAKAGPPRKVCGAHLRG
jgi:hypothetical protein